MRKLDRREFVIGAGGAALAGAVSPAKVFGQATTPAQPQPQPASLAPPTPVMRRPVGKMAPDDPALASYRRAVERMKALPESDPRSWNRVAQIHVDFCPHANWFFLPWHRAYLISFERLCRQMSGDPTFALPYWDWTEQRMLPPAFAAATIDGKPNPLFDNTREATPTSLLGDLETGPRVINRILANTDFENFGSFRPEGQNSTEARWLREGGRMAELELTPHGVTHVLMGGDMGDLVSPRDPIFWLHHCNIDRLWAVWNGLGKNNTADPLWATFQFANIFFLPDGDRTTPWNVGVSDMFEHRAWGYTYPDLPTPPAPPPDAPVAGDAPPADGGDQQVADASPPPGAGGAEAARRSPHRRLNVIASEAVKGRAGLNAVLSTQLTLQISAAAGRAGEQAAGGALSATSGPPTTSALNDLLRQEGSIGASASQPAAAPHPAGNGGMSLPQMNDLLRQEGSYSEPPPRPAAAATPAAPAGTANAAAAGAAPGLPSGRVLALLQGVRASRANAMKVNVFLNHPNPTAGTPESDPHLVGTFGLFGLQSSAAHGSYNVQVDLTETIARLQRMNRLAGGALNVQLIPVTARTGKQERSGSRFEMSVGRVSLFTM